MAKIVQLCSNMFRVAKFQNQNLLVFKGFQHVITCVNDWRYDWLMIGSEFILPNIMNDEDDEDDDSGFNVNMVWNPMIPFFVHGCTSVYHVGVHQSTGCGKNRVVNHF